MFLIRTIIEFFRCCTIIELKELNWLCKYMKNVRSRHPCISMNFWTESSSSMWVSLSSFLTKLRSCRGRLIKIKQNEKLLQRMTLASWIWTIWMMLTTVAIVGHLLHFLSPEIWPPNVELSFYQAHCSFQDLSYIAAVSEELIL